MGCFNGTCGVSNLPIISGDQIALLFLVSNSAPDNDAGHCHSNDMWSPSFFPLYGEYNDYGSIENYKNDWITKDILARVKAHVIEKEAGENEYHDLEVKADTINTMEDLLELIYKSRIEIKQWHTELFPNPHRFGFMMVHRDIYDFMSTDGEDWLGAPIKVFDTITLGNETYNQLLELLKTGGKETRELMRCGLVKFPEEKERRRTNPLRDMLDDYGRESDLSALYSPIKIRDYRRRLLQKAINDVQVGDKEVQTIITEYCKFTMFDANMNNLRRSYTIQSGAGSQSTSYERYKALHVMMEKHIDTQLEKWDSE